jgi:hypothetical protein
MLSMFRKGDSSARNWLPELGPDRRSHWVVMPARSGAFPACLRWPMVWPTCHRRPRMLVRRCGLVLASRWTPDTARCSASYVLRKSFV